MPGAHRDDLHGGSRPQPTSKYFSGLHPTMNGLQTCLAVVGLLLVLHYCFKCAYRRLRRPQASPTPQFADQKSPPVVSWERYRATYSGDVAAMKSNTTRLAGENDSAPSPLDRTSNAHVFTGPASGLAQLQTQFGTRLPPAPPLTPPELSSTIFSAGAEHHADVDSFISQPNPDYLSTSEPLPLESMASPASQRPSYDTAPISISASPQTSSFLAREGSSPEQTFAPNSFPQSNPFLPPAPPESHDPDARDDSPRRDVDVKGEIISVLDGDGAGWTRHTRVYGGGVCLACAASGGGHEGGFYGATVTPEEMR